jgi:hypothetical protein
MATTDLASYDYSARSAACKFIPSSMENTAARGEYSRFEFDFARGNKIVPPWVINGATVRPSGGATVWGSRE